MQGTRALTSGVDVVDRLIDGVRVGDNLVVILDDDLPGAWLVDRYVAAADPGKLIVVDATSRLRDRIDEDHLLDWSDGATAPRLARVQLAAADDRVGTDAAFVVDSLSELAAKWSDRAALDLFLWACPRLFRRRSVALWIVSGDRHDAAFVRQLTAITQVVVTGRAVGGEVRLEVVKADGRARAVVGRSVTARLVDGDLVGARAADAEGQRLGDRLRELRTRRGIGQSDLARRVGISPSALSQAERGVRAVSAETLVRIWEALGLPVAADDLLEPGYRVHRRSGRPSTTIAGGVSGQLRSEDPALTVWQLTFDPRSTGRSTLFAVKATETLIVLSGVLQVELHGQTEALHEGDTLVADTAAITAWSNPADTVAEVLWLLT